MIIKRIDKHVSKGYNRNPKTLSDKIRLVRRSINIAGWGIPLYAIEVLEDDGRWHHTEIKIIE